MDELLRRWWFYLLLLALFFIRPYASQGYEPEESVEVILRAFQQPLIFNAPVLMPFAKAIPVLLVAMLLVFGNAVRKAFDGYVAVLHLAIAALQHTSITEAYGLVVILGNLALILVVAVAWFWEFAVGHNVFEQFKPSPWVWWAAPMALLALAAPIDSATLQPDFDLVNMLTNPAGLTYCMMTPVVLAVLVLHHPTVNMPLLRLTSFVGILIGVVNMVVWFGVVSAGWWMGVLHIPLVTISICAFVLSLGKSLRAQTVNHGTHKHRDPAGRLRSNSADRVAEGAGGREEPPSRDQWEGVT